MLGYRRMRRLCTALRRTPQSFLLLLPRLTIRLALPFSRFVIVSLSEPSSFLCNLGLKTCYAVNVGHRSFRRMMGASMTRQGRQARASFS